MLEKSPDILPEFPLVQNVFGDDDNIHLLEMLKRISVVVYVKSTL